MGRLRAKATIRVLGNGGNQPATRRHRGNGCDRKGDGAGRIVVKENNVGGFKSFFKIAANGVLQVGKGDGGNLITGPMARAGVEGALGGLEEQHIHN